MLPRMLLQTKVVEKIKKNVQCMCGGFFFFENRAVCEVMWENYSKAG
jgi:hypothetical protein